MPWVEDNRNAKRGTERGYAFVGIPSEMKLSILKNIYFLQYFIISPD